MLLCAAPLPVLLESMAGQLVMEPDIVQAVAGWSATARFVLLDIEAEAVEIYMVVSSAEPCLLSDGYA